MFVPSNKSNTNNGIDILPNTLIANTVSSVSPVFAYSVELFMTFIRQTLQHVIYIASNQYLSYR